jgi:riboflavin kinase/FMN adenylyltransferase
VFDGLHRGHAHLLARAVELGEQRGLPVVLLVRRRATNR